MIVLLTGATGRIGQHLVRALLRDGHAVRALVLPNDPQAAALGSQVEIVYGRLEDAVTVAASAQRVEAVFHLAGALTSRGHTEAQFIDFNVRGTFNLLTAVREGAPGLRQFVYASSDAVYVAGPDEDAAYLPVDEEHPRRTGSVYGASKLGAEALCLAFHRGFGLPATVLRFGATADAAELIEPGSVFARWLFLREARAFLYRMPRLTAAQGKALAVFEALDRGEEQLVAFADADGQPEVRQWADARDIAEGCRRMLGAAQTFGQTFNLGGREPHSAEVFVRHLAERLQLPYVNACIPTARRPWYISSEKARRAVGYEPRYTVFDMVDDAIERRMANR
jgi:UDP-glucose 4-epimerase